MSRPDFFLFSKELMSLLESVQIIPGYRTDHSMVKISLNLNKIQTGKGYWKFNNSLLKDNDYITNIKNIIKETIMMYSVEQLDTRAILTCRYRDN